MFPWLETAVHTGTWWERARTIVYDERKNAFALFGTRSNRDEGLPTSSKNRVNLAPSEENQRRSPTASVGLPCFLCGPWVPPVERWILTPAKDRGWPEPTWLACS